MSNRRRSEGLFYLDSWGLTHDDVIKWKHFPRYWPFVRGIHRSPVNSLHKGQWRGALMFSLICVWINGWVNNREAGDLRRYRAHCDVTIMWIAVDSFLHLPLRTLTTWEPKRNFNSYRPDISWRYYQKRDYETASQFAHSRNRTWQINCSYNHRDYVLSTKK